MIRIFDLVSEYWPVMVRGSAAESDSLELVHYPELAENDRDDAPVVDNDYDDAELALELGVQVHVRPVENVPDSQIPPDSFSATQVQDEVQPQEEAAQTLEYIPDTLLDPETQENQPDRLPLPEEENPPDRLPLPEEESLSATLPEDTPPNETVPKDIPRNGETGEKGGEVESSKGSGEKAKQVEPMGLDAVQARIKQLKWLGSCQSILLHCLLVVIPKVFDFTLSLQLCVCFALSQNPRLMIQSSARPLQNHFDPNLDTIPCDLSPLAKEWNEPDPWMSPEPSSAAAPAPLRRAEQGVTNGTGETSTTINIDKEEVEVISLTDTPKKASQDQASPEGNATLPQQVGLKKTAPSGDGLDSTPVPEDTLAPSAPAAVGEAEGTPDSQLPQCSNGTERKSLFHSQEVVTRREQFQVRDEMKRANEQKEPEDEDEEEEGTGGSKTKKPRKKMSARAKAKAKKANEEARKAAAKEKALAKKEAKKMKALARKQEKKAKALAKKEEKKKKAEEAALAKKEEKKKKAEEAALAKKEDKKKKAEEAKEEKKTLAAAKREQKKDTGAAAKKKKVGQEKDQEDDSTTPQVEPDVADEGVKANGKGGSKRKARTVADAKAQKQAKSAPRGDVTHAPAAASAGESAPTRPKQKATFARRARPTYAVSGLRWDALKQVFNQQLQHRFLRPSRLEEK